uniref:Uncharacterized protein n=1 Tax=Kalanchoe fedtschenkoi TaxID=63787 RepID=A0A7N0VG56_KALFE
MSATRAVFMPIKIIYKRVKTRRSQRELSSSTLHHKLKSNSTEQSAVAVAVSVAVAVAVALPEPIFTGEGGRWKMSLQKPRHRRGSFKKS